MNRDRLAGIFADNTERYIEDWKTLVRFPSISADPGHAGDCRDCAGWLRDRLAALGFTFLGFLTVMPDPTVRQPGGEVFLDGKKIGSLPLIRKKVEAGRHEELVERDGLYARLHAHQQLAASIEEDRRLATRINDALRKTPPAWGCWRSTTTGRSTFVTALSARRWSSSDRCKPASPARNWIARTGSDWPTAWEDGDTKR